MLLSALYSITCLLTDLALLRCPRSTARDVELLALRQALRVLRRTTTRPARRPGDRVVVGRRMAPASCSGRSSILRTPCGLHRSLCRPITPSTSWR